MLLSCALREEGMGVWGKGLNFSTDNTEGKLISVCLDSHYSPITNLHIFVYERAECPIQPPPPPHATLQILYLL